MVAIGVLTLAACSGSDEPATSSPAATASAATESAATESDSAAPGVTEPSVTEPAGSQPDTTAGSDGEHEVMPEGFTTVTALITKTDGTTCEVCMWLADDRTERGRGLMGVTDLGAPEAMAFVFEQPTGGAFFMYQTVTPLSIAWFAPDGAFVSSTDMEPCLEADSAACPRFGADGTYQIAIEVFQGDLDTIGLGEGSRVEILADTEAPTCPVAAG